MKGIRKISAILAVFLVLSLGTAALVFYWRPGWNIFFSDEKRTAAELDSQSARILKAYSTDSTDGFQIEVPSIESTASKAELLASENFRLSKINFGGDFSLLADNELGGALSIDGIRSESFFSRDKDRAKLLISWTTSRPTSTHPEYFRSGSNDKKVLENQDLSREHRMILSDLDTATAYSFSISSTDRWGNKTESGQYGAYTSSGFISVFDLISKAVGDIFGWAFSEKK